MRSEHDLCDPASPLIYHINLVQLLALCTEGKNVYTEIKCHSLLPLDDIVRVVTHKDCIPEVKSTLSLQILLHRSVEYFKKAAIMILLLFKNPLFQVKTAYINFLNHCYIDTEVEVKEIYTSTHMWTLFQDFLEDMGRVCYSQTNIKSFSKGEKCLKTVCKVMLGYIEYFYRNQCFIR